MQGRTGCRGSQISRVEERSGDSVRDVLSNSVDFSGRFSSRLEMGSGVSCVAVEDRLILAVVRQDKTSLHLRFHEQRSALETFVTVLLVDGSVMLMRVFAAFVNECDQRMQLRVGILRVVDMSRGLCERSAKPKSSNHVSTASLTQLPFFSIIRARQ